MYLWYKLLVTGLWNYRKNQLPLIRADDGNAPNVFQKDDPSNIGNLSSQKKRSQSHGVMMEHAHKETNEILSAILASGIDKETGI